VGRSTWAVAVQLDFTGATLDQYDEVVKRMGFRPGGPGAPGLMFHWINRTTDGLRATDVWESQEQFEDFSEENIGPISRDVVFPAPPKVQFFEVHTYLTAG